MILRDNKLIELGFEKRKYDNDSIFPNTFFRKDVDGVVYEISENKKFAQWCRIDKEIINDSDFQTFDLTNPKEEAEFLDLVMEKCEVYIGN